MEDQGWFSTTAYKRLQGQRVRRGTILGILVLFASGMYTLQSHHTLDTGPKNWALPIPFMGVVSVTDVAGDTSLQPGVVMDRFALRDENDRLTAKAVKIANPADSKFRKSEIIPRSEYDAEVRRLTSESKAPPTFVEPVAGTTEYQTVTLLPHIRFTLPILLVAAGLWLSYRLVNFPAFADFLIATEAELNKVSWTTRKRLVQDTIVVLTTMLLLTGFLFVMDSAWIWILSSRWIYVMQTEKADTTELDTQIDRLNQEKEEATARGDKQMVTSLEDQIGNLSRQRDSIVRGKQGGPQEW
jgi:preprotein translocase SecE subunit